MQGRSPFGVTASGQKAGELRSRGEINGSSVESTGHFPWSLIVEAGEVSRKGPSRWWIQNGWEARRTTVFNRKVRAEKDKGIYPEGIRLDESASK